MPKIFFVFACFSVSYHQPNYKFDPLKISLLNREFVIELMVPNYEHCAFINFLLLFILITIFIFQAKKVFPDNYSTLIKYLYYATA